MDKETIQQILILGEKERLLAEIIVWLKARKLWEECQKDLSIKIIKNTEVK
jgi:hypothetical protein